MVTGLLLQLTRCALQTVTDRLLPWLVLKVHHCFHVDLLSIIYTLSDLLGLGTVENIVYEGLVLPNFNFITAST